MLLFQRCYESGRPDSNRRRPAWEAGILPTELRPRALVPTEPAVGIEPTTARLRIECSTTELRWHPCPGADSNRDALRHHPLKMACLPIPPPGRLLCSTRTMRAARTTCNSCHGADGARTRDLRCDRPAL